MEAAVLAQGLTRRFGQVTAVDGIDLEIPQGRIFGFLGPNGSGKTTTIRMLCGLLVPSAGQIRVLGRSIPRQAEELKHHIGYMTQKFSLYEDLTVAENLDFIGRIYSIPKRQRRQRVDELARLYDLVEIADRWAGVLSGGQKQRLALAAATLHQPDMLFLDEPTSAVDPESRRRFWRALFQLAEEGKTLLVSTHYMDEAERCHHLGILDQGRLVANGPPAELMGAVRETILEVETERPQQARGHLEELPEIRSVAQIGARLRVLVNPGIAQPGALVEEALRAVDLPARVRDGRVSLEDVFVLATGDRNE